MPQGEPYLLTGTPVASIDDYLRAGGGAGLEIADQLGPQGTIDEVEAAGLRGRGGAGFTTGQKWRSVASGGPEVGDRFIVVNAAEGEPGTFKDRALLRENPYQVLEGALIAAAAVGAQHVVVAIKSSFETEGARLEEAIGAVEATGWPEGRTLTLVRGPEEYLFGEEKALLEVVEGEDPLPRHLPPYLYGLFSTAPQVGWSAGLDLSSTGPAVPSSNPTVVNNVETLANVPHILRRGAHWLRSMGTAESPGHLLVTLSGDVARAAVAEVEMGTPLAEVLDVVGGGTASGRPIKAALSGVANPVVTRAMVDTPLSYEAMAAAGSGLGAAGFIVFDDSHNMVEVAYWASAFLYVESCGQCPPCKSGTGEVTRLLHGLLSGSGTESALDAIAGRLRTVDDGARCGLASQERTVVASLLTAFPEDVAAVLAGEAQLVERPLIAKLTAVEDGVATLDDRQGYKRPDWTYADSPVVIS